MLSRSLPAVAVVLAVAVFAVGAPARAGAGFGVVYELPVAGDVVARFDPPADPYGPGHRGIDLTAPVGTPVGSAARGTVSFAGLVATEQWVTVAHPDGVRTSYGPMATSVVEAGDRVRRGQIIGTSGGFSASHDADVLHVSARRGKTYIDPLTLLADWRPSLVGPGSWRGHDTDHVIRPYAPWEGGQLLGLTAAGSPDATRPGYAFAPSLNHVIGIAGFMSETGEVAMRLRDLGYAPDDITHFSYAGIGSDGQPLDYTAADTWDGVAEAAVELRALLVAHHRQHPGQAVDLVGHSMGGVVAMAYLLFLHDPTAPELPAIANVATIAAPLEGTEVAALADAIADHDVAGRVARAGDEVATALDPFGLGEWAERFDGDAASIDDLSHHSAFGMLLGPLFQRANADLHAGPLAMGTRVLTLGAQLDPVAPTHRTDLPGAQHLVLPGSHGGVTRTEAARQVLHAFLAREPLPDSPGHLAQLGSRAYGDLLADLATGLRLEQLWRRARGFLRLTRTPGTVPGR